MIDYQETLRAYSEWIYYPHCKEATIKLCKYYQDRCRFYLDEIEIYIGYIDEIRISKNIIRWVNNFIIPKHVDIMIKDYTKDTKNMIYWYQENCRFYLDEVK